MNKQIAAFLVSLFLSFSTPVFADDSDQMIKVNVNQATVQQLNETLVGVSNSRNDIENISIKN